MLSFSLDCDPSRPGLCRRAWAGPRRAWRPSLWHTMVGVAFLSMPIAGFGQTKTLPDSQVALNEPFAQWSLAYREVTGNRFDVQATAVFTHEKTGTTRRSVMFYAGENAGQDPTWQFRFTGIKQGVWTIETQGPGTLGGWTGKVTVTPAKHSRPGFLTTHERAWSWAGTGQAFVPQLVMADRPAAFWNDGRVDTDKIDAMIQQFIVETGFTGFHMAGGGGKWFQIQANDTQPSFKNPSAPAYDVLETFITRAYEKGAMTHLWLYGGNGWGHQHSGPRNLGGPRSDPAKRMLRQLAGRLGPIPGWSLGYGYDLKQWADAEELDDYKQTLDRLLGGWEHPLGARADPHEKLHDDGTFTRQPMSEVYWSGDYGGFYDYRVGYQHYVQTYEHFDKPAFQEDRFRIRESGPFGPKDYTPAMTVRGLWHSTMAGGVANIWGNLLPHDDNDRGSNAYDNQAAGTIRGHDFTVNIKDQIKAYQKFWFGNSRFAADLIRDNKLTGDRPGDGILHDPYESPISVALRGPEHKRFIFYTEQTQAVRVDLRQAPAPLFAIAIDTRRPYQEIILGKLDPTEQTWQAPHPGDWALAVGDFGQ